MLLWGLVNPSLAPKQVPHSLATAATPFPFLEPPGMASAACNHTKMSPEEYAATHTQSSCVLVHAMAGWEASVMLNDSSQEHVALHELCGLYFLLKMAFLNLPVLGLLGTVLGSATWLAQVSPCPTLDPVRGSPRFTGAACCITSTHAIKP